MAAGRDLLDQAVLELRWLVDGTDVHLLARDAKFGQATAYRYLHEAIDLVAEHAPDLPEVLAAGREAGWAFVALDGILIESTRSSARSAAGTALSASTSVHAVKRKRLILLRVSGTFLMLALNLSSSVDRWVYGLRGDPIGAWSFFLWGVVVQIIAIVIVFVTPSIFLAFYAGVLLTLASIVLLLIGGAGFM